MTNNITDLLKSFQSKPALSKNYAGASQLFTIIKAQNSWKNSISGLIMLSEITKSFNHHALTKKPYSSMIEAFSKSVAAQNKFLIPNSAIEAISKSMAIQHKLSIPSSAFDAIKAINKQHERLFSNLKFGTKAIRVNQTAISQMNNLRFAIIGISGKLSSIVATQKNWILLKEFENISGQAIELSSNVLNDIALNDEESKGFEKLIDYILTYIKKNKKFGTNALLFLSVVVNIMSLHQYYHFLKDKPAATKEDLLKFETKIIESITYKLKDLKEVKKTNRKCKVLLKPTNHTLVIEILPKDFEVVSLQINHKWIYVSYLSSKDNLPKTGWILKKYLDRP
jgi:hypothetical protein